MQEIQVRIQVNDNGTGSVRTQPLGCPGRVLEFLTFRGMQVAVSDILEATFEELFPQEALKEERISL